VDKGRRIRHDEIPKNTICNLNSEGIVCIIISIWWDIINFVNRGEAHPFSIYSKMNIHFNRMIFQINKYNNSLMQIICWCSTPAKDTLTRAMIITQPSSNNPFELPIFDWVKAV